MEEDLSKHSNRLFSFESEHTAPNFLNNFKSLFKSAFITNCHLDDASVTAEELETLEELDQGEVLENLKDLLDTLLNFKSNIKAERSGELATRCDQLEKMLQKQESEVRNHIRNEHQLKIHIDSLQQRLLELETKAGESHSLSKDEGKGGETMREQLKKLESKFQKEINKLNSRYKAENPKDSEKIQKLEELFEKKEKSYVKLQSDFQKMRSLLEDTTKECKMLRREVEKYTGLGGNGEAITKRQQDLVESNLNKVHLVNKSLMEKRRGHSKKKSCEVFFQASKFDPTPPDGSRPHSVVRASLYNSRKHVRSHSEYTRPVSSKKIYVKHS